jgi:hypothetical protein
MQNRLPRSLPGRKCAFCGYHGGAGFTTLVKLATDSGVVLKHLSGHGMEYLHSNCARRVQKLAAARMLSRGKESDNA